MADFELKITGELSELAAIASRLSGPILVGVADRSAAATIGGTTLLSDPSPQAATDATVDAAPAKRTRKAAGTTATLIGAADEGNVQTADAASPADTGASQTEASSASGSATDASPSPTPAAEAPKPESITHPDQLLGGAVTPDMLKDAMTDALSKRQIPAAKVQAALKEATGGVASLSALWALPDDADRAAKATAAYAALTGLTA